MGNGAMGAREAVAQALVKNGYNLDPEFVILGQLGGGNSAGIFDKLGSGVFAIAVFDDFLVHVFGRLGSKSSLGLGGSNQLIIREIPAKAIESVSLNTVVGVGGTLTLRIAEKGGLLSQMVSGGDIVLALSDDQLNDQRSEISVLRVRFQ